MTGKSTSFDDPNREALGLAPIWTGAGDTTPPEPEVEPEGKSKKAAKKDAPDEDA